MKNRFQFLRVLLLGAAVATVSGGWVRADTTNYWTDPGTGYSGNYTNAAHWTGIVPITTADSSWFSNRQSSAYTVQFTSSPTNGPLSVYEDNVAFDLKGYNWQIANGGSIGSNGASATTVRFSSSASPQVTGGNVVHFGTGYYNGGYFMGPNTTILIDDSLGQPVQFVWKGGGAATGPSYGATLVVSGNGTEMLWDGGYYVPGVAGYNILVTNQARFVVSNTIADSIGFGAYSFGIGPTTVTVANASMKTAITTTTYIGGDYGGDATIILSNHSAWTESAAKTQVGYGWYPGADGYSGRLLMDQSTFNGQSMRVGDDPFIVSGRLGLVEVRNGSTMTLSNSLWITTNAYAGVRDKFVLNHSTLYLGGGAINGTITNQGILQAQGTISGQGPGNFLLRNEADLHVGGSPGVLTLNKGNVELAAGSVNYFEFSDTAISQIVAANGYASLLGSNLFSLASGAPAPVPGVKYGLGLYNFVIGTNLTSAPQYDNLVNLLTNTYGLTYGVDFQYGVVNLGNGLFALELAFVPEPSTVLLLGLGGLMIFRLRQGFGGQGRRMAKGRKPVAGSR